MDNRETRTARREVSVAGHCMHAGQEALDQAVSYTDDYPGWRTAMCMSANAMWAFALEADVNHLLSRLAESKPAVLARAGSPRLDDALWLPLRERVELFYDWADAPRPDFGCSPFTVVGTLKSIRDQVVHGRPHLVELEVKVTNGELKKIPRALLADWEPECTPAHATRHRDDVIAVHKQMVTAAGGMLGDPLSFTDLLGLGWSPS